jgi:hypothetical protein
VVVVGFSGALGRLLHGGTGWLSERPASDVGTATTDGQRGEPSTTQTLSHR